MIHSKCWKGKRCKLGYSTGEGNGTPLQYSCLENPMDGGAWKAAVHGVAEAQVWLSDFTFTFHFSALEKEMATLQCSCLENPRDGEAWWAAIYGVAQSRTRLKWLSSSRILYGDWINRRLKMGIKHKTVASLSDVDICLLWVFEGSGWLLW